MSRNEERQARAVELQQQAKTKKGNKPRQKAGKFATQPSHFKGRDAEDGRARFFKHCLSYSRMVSFSPGGPNDQAAENASNLASFPRIHAFGIIFDPYKPSNPMGGARKKKAALLRREKEIVIITAPFEGAIDDIKAKLTRLVNSDFGSTDDFDVHFVVEEENAMSIQHNDSTRVRTRMAQASADEVQNELDELPIDLETPARGRGQQ
jgi:hypothetical protein